MNKKLLCNESLVTLLLYGIAVAQTAAAKCQIGAMAELPVTMQDLRPVVTVQFDGQPARLTADSGAFYSMITQATAAQYGLKLKPAPVDLYVRGVNGAADVSLTVVKNFALEHLKFKNAEFLVGGSEPMGGTVGILGQNLLGFADTEYDLAGGVIRLLRSTDCAKTPLAYWARDESVSMIEIQSLSQSMFHTVGTGYLNGRQIRIAFDTGAQLSMLSRQAARRAGIEVTAPGVSAAGMSTGLGRKWVKTWVATFASLRLDAEEVKNARLRIGDVDLQDWDMLLGADFFLSHRVYVANSQHRLYFTYNGGPVFNLQAVHAEPAGTSDTVPGQDPEPADAAGFSRRGMARASRQDYEHALADLTRACELSPAEALYFEQRGMIHRRSGQADLARADFDQALKLAPGDPAALLQRAELRLQAGDVSGGESDLAAADQAAPREADERLAMGEIYEQLGLHDPAIRQLDLWISVHADDARLPVAQNSRCWARALLGTNLDQALSDCNAAVKSNGKVASFLDSRGLVRLRRGEYQKSISDYDASLSLMPRNAWSLYGRGLAKRRLGRNGEGQADIDAALVLQPKIAELAAASGVGP